MKSFIDVDKGERIPNPAIGTIIRQGGHFYEILDERWLRRCPCPKPDCAGEQREYNLMPINLAG